MNLSRKIADVLDNLTLDDGQTTTIQAEHGPHRASLALLHASRAGIEASALEFHTSEPPEWTVESLKAWGDRVASRVTYLMEPLVVLEADPVDVEVAMRSRVPSQRDGRRTYYEARLNNSGTLRLRRVAFDESTRRREEVPFQLTREALDRLVDDLAATTVA